MESDLKVNKGFARISLNRRFVSLRICNLAFCMLSLRMPPVSENIFFADASVIMELNCDREGFSPDKENCAV